MAVAKKKLVVSLAVGATMGIASLASLTSSPGTVKTAEVTPKAPVVKSAPCPAGTIDTPTACVRQVKVPAPAPAAAAPATTTRTATATRTATTYSEPQEQEPQEREAPEAPEPGEQGQGDEQRAEHSRG
jgi:hypothetical protein